MSRVELIDEVARKVLENLEDRLAIDDAKCEIEV